MWCAGGAAGLDCEEEAAAAEQGLHLHQARHQVHGAETEGPAVGEGSRGGWGGCTCIAAVPLREGRACGLCWRGFLVWRKAGGRNWGAALLCNSRPLGVCERSGCQGRGSGGKGGVRPCKDPVLRVWLRTAPSLFQVVGFPGQLAQAVPHVLQAVKCAPSCSCPVGSPAAIGARGEVVAPLASHQPLTANQCSGLSL